MAEELQKLYLTNIHLKRFKSIIDVKIDIKKGLNILIGKNGAGKSNFLEGVKDSYNIAYLQNRSYFKSSILTFISSNNKTVRIESEKVIDPQPTKINTENRGQSTNIFQRLFINDELYYSTSLAGNRPLFGYINQIASTEHSLNRALYNQGYDPLNLLLIKFDTPQRISYVSDSQSLKFIMDEFFDEALDGSELSFMKALFWQLEFKYERDNDKIAGIDKLGFLKEVAISPLIISNLNQFTPIEEIRFNENINIYRNPKGVIIENIKLDFKVNGEWQPWSQLSDGTKRLFILVAEITHHQGGLILVEEPELGVHPHQFDLIMTFLKEQAETKQIIISTHSPQALNHLGPDELDHLIVAKYEPKKGTQLYHLTEEQKVKAKAYMDEVGFLSDYWMHSDLEEW